MCLQACRQSSVPDTWPLSTRLEGSYRQAVGLRIDRGELVEGQSTHLQIKKNTQFGSSLKLRSRIMMRLRHISCILLLVVHNFPKAMYM